MLRLQPRTFHLMSAPWLWRPGRQDGLRRGARDFPALGSLQSEDPELEELLRPVISPTNPRRRWIFVGKPHSFGCSEEDAWGAVQEMRKLLASKVNQRMCGHAPLREARMVTPNQCNQLLAIKQGELRQSQKEDVRFGFLS